MPPCRSPRCSSSPSLERRFPATTASSTPTASRPPNGFVTLGSTTTAGRAGLVGPDGSAVLIGQAGTNGIFWARVRENGGGGGTCTFTPSGLRGLVLRLDNAYIFADGFEAGSTASW